MMKLKLHLGDLAVESFAALPEPTPQVGTVRGAATNYMNPSECDPSFCVAASCDWTKCNDLSCAGYCTNTGGGGGGDTLNAATCSVKLCPVDSE